MVRTGTFQFVRHGDVDAFHQRGWMIAGDLGRTHGVWSVLMWHASFPDCEICIKAEGEVLGQYEAGPTSPERVSVRVGGIITTVPVANVEVVR